MPSPSSVAAASPQRACGPCRPAAPSAPPKKPRAARQRHPQGSGQRTGERALACPPCPSPPLPSR
eukprot:6883460-Prorocentrum_lima.AAC.1